MRLPGTWNPSGKNKLISLTYLRALKTAQKKKDGDKVDGDANTSEKKALKNTGTEAKKTGTSEWTDAQDAELLKLKVDENPWKAIATALDKHVHEVKKRWGEIRPKDGTGDKKAEQYKKTEHDKKAGDANSKTQRREDKRARVESDNSDAGSNDEPDANFDANEVESVQN